MTREDIKTITDIVHKTIYEFFDVCGDDEETPMTDKDKLLLDINKAICSNVKALEQESCEDAISRKDTLAEFKRIYFDNNTVIRCAELVLNGMPPITTQQKTGYWIIYDVHGHKACKCSECNKDVGYPCNDKYCPKCGTKITKMIEL